MNTQNEKPKNEKPVSRLYIVEKGTWKNAMEVLTFYYKNDQGKPIAIGHVYAHYDKEGKVSFGSQDSKGNDIFPPCSNRYELKKMFLENENDLIQKAERKQEQEKNPVQQNVQQDNKPEQVQQPVNNVQSEQKPPNEKTSRRRNELKEVRNEKENSEKEQSLTH